MKSFAAVFLFVIFSFLALASSAPPAALRMQKKLAYLQSNAASPHPNPAPTAFTEEEINSYLNSDLVELPAGVQLVHFSGVAGALTASARIDFDQVKAGRNSSNPLLLAFSGIHQVQVAAHAHGENGQGFVHVDSVQLDGIEIPEFILKLFVEKYLQPKYPNVGMDSQFALPERIVSADIHAHMLVVVQK